MTEHRDFLNVRSLAVILAASPLALLLFFGALDLSWVRFSHANPPVPTKGSVAEIVPTKSND